MPQVMEETQRVPFDQTVCVFFRGSKIQTITQSQDQHTAAGKCGNLAHGDDATGRQPLLAGPWLLAARRYIASMWKTSETKILCFAAVYLRLCGNELPSSLTRALLNIYIKIKQKKKNRAPK